MHWGPACVKGPGSVPWIVTGYARGCPCLMREGEAEFQSGWERLLGGGGPWAEHRHLTSLQRGPDGLSVPLRGHPDFGW